MTAAASPAMKMRRRGRAQDDLALTCVLSRYRRRLFGLAVVGHAIGHVDTPCKDNGTIGGLFRGRARERTFPADRAPPRAEPGAGA
jgi:hypothetical protein